MPTGNLPSEGKKLFEEVYQKALKGSCKGDESCAAASAWSAVKGAGWSKDKDGKWHKKSDLKEFSLAIIKASHDPRTGEKRWRAVASDTDTDSYNDNMTLELFEDFERRIENDESPPEEFRSEFWDGGMPYLSVSHYPDLDGKAVPGVAHAVYTDGNRFKARGSFTDTPIGNASFDAVRRDLEDKNKEDKIRISIAFLDYMHKHKSNGFVFERKSLDDVCPECIREIVSGKEVGKYYLKGHLIHLALTRVPVNKRTSMEVERSMTTRKEDAASIIGDELAEEIDGVAKLVGKSEALVIKAEDEPIVEEAETVTSDEQDEEEAEKEKKALNAKDEEEALNEKADTTEEIDLVESLKSCKIAVDELKSLIAEKSVVSLSNEKTELEHPLDAVIQQFKADYDVAVASDFTPEDKLRRIQDSFTALGQTVIETVNKTDEKPVEQKSDADTRLDTIERSMVSLAESMKLLTMTVSQIKPTTEKSEAVTVRRSIQPTKEMQLDILKPREQKPKSITPNLRALIEKTT